MARLGEVEALVVPQLRDNLVSLGDFADRGSTVELGAETGVVRNPFNDKEIPMFKREGVRGVSS